MNDIHPPTNPETTKVETIKLNSTLRDLRMIDFQLDETSRGEKLFHAFQNDALLPGAILNQQGKLKGFISRAKFLEITSRPFAREIFLRRSLSRLYLTNPLILTNITILSADMLIFEAVRVCLQRSPEYLYEPIVVDIGDKNYQLLPFQDLLVAQSQIYQIAMRTIEESNADLAKANDEIIALNERLKEDNLRMGAELDVARQIQMMILPRPEELENIAGLDIAGYMEPADEVGGDYYDVLHTDGVVTLGIGDVTGHGLESGILMLMTQTAVRTLQEIREADPVIFLDTLNRTIYKNVQRMDSQKSLTLAIVNYADGKISISGQHEETILVRKGGHIERIDTMSLGFPIGLDSDITEFINHVVFELEPGDGIVLYTDGIPEAKDINKVQYQVERLCEVVSENWDKSAAGVKDAIVADVRRHIGTQKVFDDITLLVLKRQEATTEEVQQQLAETEIIEEGGGQPLPDPDELLPQTNSASRGYVEMSQPLTESDHISELFGNFITGFAPENDSLEIAFTPSSRPIKQRWKNNRLSAHFIADYFTNFLPSDEESPNREQRIKSSKSAVSYVANELLENALKFNDENSQYKVRFGIHFVEEAGEVTAAIFATNSIKPGAEEKLKVFIEELLTSDPNDLYVRQVEKSIEEDTAASGLGLLTMINDYGAEIGWKLETIPGDNPIIIVTTMAQIKV